MLGVSSPPRAATKLLSGDGVSLTQLGLLTGRAAAALRRIADDQSIDDVDVRALHKVADILQLSSETVAFFEAPSTHAGPPAGALTSGVSIAVDTMRLTDGHNDEAVAAMLHRAAESLRTVASSSDDQLAAELLPWLEQLSHAVLRATASVGETTGRF